MFRFIRYFIITDWGRLLSFLFACFLFSLIYSLYLAVYLSLPALVLLFGCISFLLFYYLLWGLASRPILFFYSLAGAFFVSILIRLAVVWLFNPLTIGALFLIMCYFFWHIIQSRLRGLPLIKIIILDSLLMLLSIAIIIISLLL